MSDDVYTIEQAADKLQVSERFLQDKIKAGDLKAYKTGRRFYILHSDLIAFVKTGKAGTAARVRSGVTGAAQKK